MRAIVRQGGKRVLLDTERDVRLWNGSRRGGGHGNSPTRWTEFLMHECKDGERVFYHYHRTLWQGESNSIEVLALDDAQLFAEEHYEDLDADDDQLKAWGLIDLEAVE